MSSADAGLRNPELPAAKPASQKHDARQPSWSRMRRALASIRFSPADRPRLASRPARSRTTSTIWTKSPDASFSRFALYRCDQSRPSSPPSTGTPQPISKLPGVLPGGPKARSQDDSDRTHCHAAACVVLTPAWRCYGPELPGAAGGGADASASRACSRARISSGV